MSEDELNKFKRRLVKEIVENMKFTVERNLFSFKLPDGFTDWLLENGKLFEHTVTEIPNDLKITNSTAGNCFHNSQLVSLENKNVLYYEGLWSSTKLNNLTHHAFNVIQNKVLDISYLANKLDLDKQLEEKEFYYFGVEIDCDFFKDNNKIFEIKYYNNPLLLSYYNSSS